MEIDYFKARERRHRAMAAAAKHDAARRAHFELANAYAMRAGQCRRGTLPKIE